MVQLFTILAPEISNLQQTRPCLIRSNREASSELSRQEIHASFDTIHTFKPKTSFLDQQSVSFDSYCRRSSLQKSYLENERYRSSLETFHPRYQKENEDKPWMFDFTSSIGNSASSNIESDLDLKGRFKYKINYKDRTDFLSLSLSPPGSRNNYSFREFPSLWVYISFIV